MSAIDRAEAKRARKNAKRDRDFARSLLGHRPPRPPRDMTPEVLAVARESLRLLVNRARLGMFGDHSVILRFEKEVASQ